MEKLIKMKVKIKALPLRNPIYRYTTWRQKTASNFCVMVKIGGFDNAPESPFELWKPLPIF